MPAAGVSYTIGNDIDEIAPVVDAVRRQLQQAAVAEKTAFEVALAIDEIVTNVISYAYDDDEVHSINLAVRIEDGMVRVDVDDDGRAFDPFSPALPEVDTSLPVAAREIGGLGIYFVRQFMDKVSYARIDGRNHVTLHRQCLPDAGAAPGDRSQ